MQPYNYNIDVAQPFANAVKGYAVGQQLGQGVKAAQAAPELEEAQMQAREALSAFANKAQPTAKDYQRVLLFNPGLKDVIGEGWKAMSAERRKADFGFGAQVLAATAGGKTDVASQLLTERATAARNSGDTAQADLFDTYAKMVTINPKGAERGIGLMLAAVDPDGFDKAYGAITSARATEAELPAKVAKAEADAIKAGIEADTAPDVIAADVAYKQRQTQRLDEMTANEAARLGLDEREYAFEVGKYADTIAKDVDEGAGLATLSVGAEKIIDDATTAAVTATARAAKARQLAAKYKGLEGGGWTTQTKQYFKEVFSGERDLLLTEAAGLLNQEVVSMLPPGPATDRDITIMREGVPSAYSDPAKVAAFLGAMARTSERVARSQAARASWVSQNGNVGVARRDMLIEGRPVRKGLSFVQHMKNIGDGERKAGG